MVIEKYMKDGADNQSRAVLAMLGDVTIEDSWNKKYNWYDATILVSRWRNCREQGYILSLRKSQKQLNVVFFEHRNSDKISIIKWEQVSINPITIESAKFNGSYKDKYDTTKDFTYGEILQAAEWIENEFLKWYN